MSRAAKERRFFNSPEMGQMEDGLYEELDTWWNFHRYWYCADCDFGAVNDQIAVDGGDVRKENYV